MPGIGITLEGCSLVLRGRRVLDDVCLDVAPGARLLLVGANGAGKTQLIKMLGGLRWPTASAGRGERRYRDARGRRLHLVDVRRHVAYVGAESQDRYTRRGWNHTIAEVVTTGLFGTDIPLDRPTAAGRRAVAQWLARFGLQGAADRRFLEVSCGQRRLALVARALAARPWLLLLDEVMNGLDEGHRRRLLVALRDVGRPMPTVVASAHRPEDVLPGMQAAVIVEHGRVRGVPLGRVLRELARGAKSPSRVRGALRAPTARTPVIELRGATVYREDRPALRALDWVLRDGENWAVTGRNGSGKSTFLGVLYGMYPVAVGGELLRRGQPRGTPLDEIRRRISIASPELQSGFDPTATLEEIVASGLRDSVGLDSPPTRSERARARRALAALALLPLARRMPGEVSYGELRLALLARALVKRPRLLLLDEPFTGLDPGRRRQLLGALSALAGRGTQLVMAVHHRDDLPPEVDRRLNFVRGRGSVLRPVRQGRVAPTAVTTAAGQPGTRRPRGRARKPTS